MCARYWRACACLQRRPKVSAENVIILGNGIVLVIQAQAVEWKKLYALYCYIDDIIVPKRNKLCLYIMQMPSGTFAATYTVPYVNGFIDIVYLSEDSFLFIKKKQKMFGIALGLASDLVKSLLFAPQKHSR